MFVKSNGKNGDRGDSGGNHNSSRGDGYCSGCNGGSLDGGAG